MLHDIAVILFLAAVPACFSYLLDYTLGFPGSEKINHKAIFFKHSYKLARRALVRTGNYKRVMNDLTAFRADKDAIVQTIFFEGRKYFTWEAVLGMCMFCTNFWLSIIAALVMMHTVSLQHIAPGLLLLFIPIFSHSILRKI